MIATICYKCVHANKLLSIIVYIEMVKLQKNGSLGNLEEQ